MPGEASTTGAGIALDAMTGRATQTARTTYLALLSAAPTDSTTVATMSEVTTAGYGGRKAVTWSAPTGDPQVTSNTNAMTFGAFTADPPSVGWLALVSSASGTTGDLIYFWTVDSARDAAIGDSITVAVGAVSMSLD
ncbi:MAG TPA: hypothetical protein VF642_12175 [Propionibacteriaceae bacterium]|jgi:hypothetical protein